MKNVSDECLPSVAGTKEKDRMRSIGGRILLMKHNKAEESRSRKHTPTRE